MVRQHVWPFEKRESKIKNLIADIHQQFSNKNSSEQVQSIVNEEVANQIVSQAQVEKQANRRQPAKLFYSKHFDVNGNAKSIGDHSQLKQELERLENW